MLLAEAADKGVGKGKTLVCSSWSPPALCRKSPPPRHRGSFRQKEGRQPKAGPSTDEEDLLSSVMDLGSL